MLVYCNKLQHTNNGTDWSIRKIVFISATPVLSFLPSADSNFNWKQFVTSSLKPSFYNLPFRTFQYFLIMPELSTREKRATQRTSKLPRVIFGDFPTIFHYDNGTCITYRISPICCRFWVTPSNCCFF